MFSQDTNTRFSRGIAIVLIGHVKWSPCNRGELRTVRLSNENVGVHSAQSFEAWWSGRFPTSKRRVDEQVSEEVD